MMTIQKLADDAQKLFVKAKRPDGSEFTKLALVAPEWLSDLVREAHDGMLPDNHKYEFIEDALTAIAETEDLDDARTEIGEQVDFTTHKLTAWLASYNARVAYCDEALDDADLETTCQLLTRGQLYERLEVFDSVCAELSKQLEIEHDKESEKTEEKE